jgi:hypothetical protein
LNFNENATTHPLYSPDLTCDSSPFLKMKSKLNGRCSENTEEIRTKLHGSDRDAAAK